MTFGGTTFCDRANRTWTEAAEAWNHCFGLGVLNASQVPCRRLRDDALNAFGPDAPAIPQLPQRTFDVRQQTQAWTAALMFSRGRQALRPCLRRHGFVTTRWRPATWRHGFAKRLDSTACLAFYPGRWATTILARFGAGKKSQLKRVYVAFRGAAGLAACAVRQRALSTFIAKIVGGCIRRSTASRVDEDFTPRRERVWAVTRVEFSSKPELMGFSLPPILKVIALVSVQHVQVAA